MAGLHRLVTFPACVFFLFVLILGGCAQESGLSDVGAEISPEDYDIIFVGVVDEDVLFLHKEHSDRFNGECFLCHNCADVLGETLWSCQDCHSPLDPEELCSEWVTDDDHGCTFFHCDNCHRQYSESDDFDPPAGDSCGVCHKPVS